MTSSDPTPGDHDEMLAEAKATQGYSEGDLRSLVRSLADALRDEESARQAAERRIDAAYKALTRPVPNGANRTAALAALTAPTESKEPTPKLDPEPWNAGNGRGNHAWTDKCVEAGCKFKPRPEFSQNPADYGIEAPDRAWECRDCGNKWRTSRTPKSETCPECNSIMIAGGVVEHDEDRDVPHE